MSSFGVGARRLEARQAQLVETVAAQFLAAARRVKALEECVRCLEQDLRGGAKPASNKPRTPRTSATPRPRDEPAAAAVVVDSLDDEELPVPPPRARDAAAPSSAQTLPAEPAPPVAAPAVVVLAARASPAPREQTSCSSVVDDDDCAAAAAGDLRDAAALHSALPLDVADARDWNFVLFEYLHRRLF